MPLGSVAFLRSRVGGIPYRRLNASLNRRRLEKPLANATSVIGNAVSVSSCLASSSRRVSSSWIGAHPQLLPDDAADLARAELELVRDRLQSRLLVEVPLLETLHDQLRNPLRVVHGRVPGGELRPTPQARAEAGLLGFVRRAEEPAVGRLGRPGGTDGPAVDTGRGDADEEHAVEARVARGQRLVEPSMVVVHPLTIRG